MMPHEAPDRGVWGVLPPALLVGPLNVRALGQGPLDKRALLTPSANET